MKQKTLKYAEMVREALGRTDYEVSDVTLIPEPLRAHRTDGVCTSPKCFCQER